MIRMFCGKTTVLTVDYVNVKVGVKLRITTG